MNFRLSLYWSCVARFHNFIPKIEGEWFDDGRSEGLKMEFCRSREIERITT
jgi:hypothetical protein